MDEIFALLKSADTAMVAVTVALCQIIKRVLPSPPVEIEGAPYDPWKTVKRLTWVPFASAFLIGVILHLAFGLDYGQPVLHRVRDGLQTGAFAVCGYELWSNAKKLFGG